MRLDHAEDLAKFVEELKRETDRGLPLVGAALIDEKLLETMQSFFVEGKSLPCYKCIFSLLLRLTDNSVRF